MILSYICLSIFIYVYVYEYGFIYVWTVPIFSIFAVDLSVNVNYFMFMLSVDKILQRGSNHGPLALGVSIILRDHRARWSHGIRIEIHVTIKLQTFLQIKFTIIKLINFSVTLYRTVQKLKSPGLGWGWTYSDNNRNSYHQKY